MERARFEQRFARLHVSLGAVVILSLVGVGVAVLVTAVAPHGASRSILPPETTTSALPNAGGSMLFVHILGEVQRPGLYELREGDRTVDAIAAAGGFTPDADQAQLNLARFVGDGEQIYVPKQGEVPAGPAGGAEGKVNINTADAAALEQLAGIGPALAQRIVEWREANGRFSAIDDLMNVTGIGEKTLSGFRDSVTL